MTRVLVTGGSGFVGRHAVEALAGRGFEVHAAARRAHDGPAIVHECDLLEPGAAAALMEEVRPSHLLHLAWYVEPGAFWSSPENVRWVEASLALARAFADAGGRRLVMAGTCAEYDWSGGVCTEQVTPLAPATLYGVCKHALHSVAAGLAAERGLSFAWGRIFFLYGPDEHPSRLAATVIGQLLRGEPAELSEGSQERDFLHAADAGAAFAALTASSVEGAINVASGERTSVRALAEAAAEAAGRPDLLRFGARETRPGEPPLIVADVRRLAGEVGFRPRHTLRSGIGETVAAWRERLPSRGA